MLNSRIHDIRHYLFVDVKPDVIPPKSLTLEQGGSAAGKQFQDSFPLSSITPDQLIRYLGDKITVVNISALASFTSLIDNPQTVNIQVCFLPILLH